MHFAAPLYFLLGLAALLFFWLARRKRKALGHSQVKALDGLPPAPPIARAPSVCRVLFTLTLIVTACQPQLIQKLVTFIFYTRDFIFTVDVSGSMHSNILDLIAKKFVETAVASAPKSPAGATQTTTDSAAAKKPEPPTRAMAAREGVRQFLKRREHDRVGLITFDDRCYFSEPLGSPKAVEKKLDAILYNGNGTNFDGPSSTASEPGAIACSIQHFIDMHATKTRVLIMVTDGDATIDKDRGDLFAKAIHAEHIRMYVLGVGESWQQPGKKVLQEFVERPEVGGRVIRVGDVQQMNEAFALIDKLETSKALGEAQSKAFELYPYFAALALLLLIARSGIAAYVRDQM